MTAAALMWTPRLMGFREGRIRGEISSLKDALKWVYESYKELVEGGAGYEIVAYTPQQGREHTTTVELPAAENPYR